MKKIILLTCFVTLLLAGCKGQKAETEMNESVVETSPSLVSLCGDIDYTDTVSLHKEEVMSGHMTEIVKLMAEADSVDISDGLKIFFKGLKGDPVSFRAVGHYADLYLNNPQSPVRDEDLYIRFLEILLQTDNLSEDVKVREGDNLKRARLNRPGMIASDFRYKDRFGKETTLHQTEGEEIMLVFYDPECPHCDETLQKIITDQYVNESIEQGSLKVLAVYAEGKWKVWTDANREMPRNWIVAYDLTGVLDKELYDLPAMPTVYLLDKHKRVIIKDMPW